MGMFDEGPIIRPGRLALPQRAPMRIHTSGGVARDVELQVQPVDLPYVSG
jgi:hypothetical protein